MEKPVVVDSSFPMNDQIRTQVRAIRALAVAPNGQGILASICDATADGGGPRLWMLAPGQPGRQLTFGAVGDTDGETLQQFSPDGHHAVYVAKRDGLKSLFRLPLTGGEAETLNLFREPSGAFRHRWGGRLTGVRLEIEGFAYSPDGKYLSLWAEDPKPASIKIRSDRKDDSYRHEKPNAKLHLYVLDVSTEAARLVVLDSSVIKLAWSRNASELIVSTDPQSDLTGANAKFWRLNPRSGDVESIPLPPTASAVGMLPVSQRLLYTLPSSTEAPPTSIALHVLDLSHAQSTLLLEDLDQSILANLVILRDDNVAMIVPTGTRNCLSIVSTRDGHRSDVDLDWPIVDLLATNREQTLWAMVVSGPTEPARVVILTGFVGAPQRLHHPPVAPSAWPKVPSRLVRWHNEGLDIEGLLYLPDISPGEKRPLVVNIHGGPSDRFRDDYSPLVQLLVAQGWAVFQPNIRGSTGYGAAFMGANKNDLGGADYRDAMKGIDAVLEHYPLDADRMALIGYSYGGEIAAFAVGRTDRFRAIVSGAPVTNQTSEYGTERDSFYDRWFYGRPWDSINDVWRQSPIAYAKNAKSPFLLIHGEKDLTDPLGQSLEMWRALKQYGAPVELIVYPRADHAETGNNFRGLVAHEPWHGIDLRRRYLGFLHAAFSGEGDPLEYVRSFVD